MSTINPVQLMDAYEQARTLVTEDAVLSGQFAAVHTAFEDKRSKPDAVIMVYGVYNAGKSTLINALLQSEAAPMGDIPLTDRVTSYRWGSYSILDTPGVDAPIDHENVTRTQMLKADAIIFVVDPLGIVEEAKTLNVLLDMLQERKQIFLVFNEKKTVTEDVFIHLKDQVRSQLQALAAERGLDAVLKDIPISKVNARMALQGYTGGKPALVDHSAFPAFTLRLQAFLREVGPDEVYGRLKHALLAFTDVAKTELESRSQSELVRKYDKLLRSIDTERARLAQGMKRELGRQRANIHEMSKVYMRTSPDTCKEQIEGLLRQAGDQVGESLQHELQLVVALVQQEIDAFQVELPQVGWQGGTVKAPVFDKAGVDVLAAQADGNAAGGVGIQVGDAITKVASMARPDHIVSGLKVVKDILPSLMKGIGIKTMEKIAANVVTKWIPYVGVATTVGQGLYALFRGDPEEELLRQQHAQAQRAQERAVQQMEDFARELSEGFDSAMQAVVRKEIAEFFGALGAQVDEMRTHFSQSEQHTSRQLEALLALRQQASQA